MRMDSKVVLLKFESAKHVFLSIQTHGSGKKFIIINEEKLEIMSRIIP